MDQNYELNIDPNVICRICLNETAPLKTIFCNEIIAGGIVPFPKVLADITNIKATKDDKFPDKLCSTCRGTIIDSYVLKQKCHQNRLLLCQILNIPVVEEQESLGVNDKSLPPPPIKTTATTQTDDVVCESQETQTNRTLNKTNQTQTAANSIRSFCTQTDPMPSQLKPDLTATEADYLEIFLDENAHTEDLETIDEIYDMDSGDEEDEVRIGPNQFKVKVLENAAVVDSGSNSISDDCETIVSVEGGGGGKNDGTVEYLIEVDESKHMCFHCMSLFPSAIELGEHVETCVADAAGKESSYSSSPSTVKRRKIEPKKHKFCNICKINLQSPLATIESHMAAHEQSLPVMLESVLYLRCSTCRIVFITTGQLRDHFASTCPGGNDDDDDDDVDDKRAAKCTNYQFIDDPTVPPIENTHRMCSCIKLSTGMFMCDWCQEYSAASVDDILQHFCEQHVEETIIPCDVQDFEFMPKCADTFRSPHQCGSADGCDQTFDNVGDAMRHAYFHADSYSCPYGQCTDVYKKFYQMNQHVERSHTQSVHDCAHCPATFETFIHLRSHLRDECKGRSLKCNTCSKKFFTKNTLFAHQKYHSKDKSLACQYCEKRFTQSGDLKTHERIHTGERPYKCSMCEKSFRTTGNRKDHMATHTNTNQYSCSQCDSFFKSERTLRGHMKLHMTEPKPHKCDECDMSFYRMFHLKTHKKVHNKNKSVE